jgi:hypothetical protein
MLKVVMAGVICTRCYLINGEIGRFACFVLPMQVAVQGNNVKHQSFKIQTGVVYMLCRFLRLDLQVFERRR